MEHLATLDSLKPGPEKIRAILEMPELQDVAGWWWFLGTMQYLAKFLPKLSELKGPLRMLGCKDTK